MSTHNSPEKSGSKTLTIVNTSIQSGNANSIVVLNRVLNRLCFNKFSKYRKLPVFYLNIYQRIIGVSKWYLEGYFHFHWLEIQQVEEVLEKIQNEIGKTYSYFKRLGNYT